MTYKFGLTGGELVVLKEHDDPLVIISEATSIHFIDDGEENDSMVSYSPSLDFWKYLIRANEYTSELSTAKKHMAGIPDEAIPPVEEWGIPYHPDLPKYEEKIVVEVTSRLLELREDTIRPFDENPSLRRLFRTAYVEAKGEVPEYLRESRPY